MGEPRILERHIWAAWIEAQVRGAEKAREDVGPANVPEFDQSKRPVSAVSLGSYVEDRLIAEMAKVTLTGHWYSPNSPSDWKERLSSWAATYGDKLRSK